MRLRYTGRVATVFQHAGPAVPGQVLDVPDERAAGLLVRPDIEQVPDEAPPPRRRRKTPQPAVPAPEPEPAPAAPADTSSTPRRGQ